MDKLKMKFISFMNGRFGQDELGKFLTAISIVCLLFSFTEFGRPFYYFGILFLIICYFRMFSKNIMKRDNERRKYLKIKNKVLSGFRSTKKRFRERRTHCFFKCSKCSQMIRIPKGKGNISISCPKCKYEFLAKT